MIARIKMDQQDHSYWPTYRLTVQIFQKWLICFTENYSSVLNGEAGIPSALYKLAHRIRLPHRYSIQRVDAIKFYSQNI